MRRFPRDYRLFHYTSCFDYLRDMLLYGFWARYCIEDFTWLVGQCTFIAFPIVCFCDIPIPAASEHRFRYGRYALAMSKSWSIQSDINPVWYIQVPSLISCHLREVAGNQLRENLSSIPDTIRPRLPFLKLTVGPQPARQHTRHPGRLELCAFEQELEWRHTPGSLEHTWKFGNHRDIVVPEDHELSKSHRLSLDHKYVDSVYVCTRAERRSLMKEFFGLADKVKIIAGL